MQVVVDDRRPGRRRPARPRAPLVAAWVHADAVDQVSGSLTFECRDIRPSGEGRLLAHLEQRKRALQAEGLFDPALQEAAAVPAAPRSAWSPARTRAAERDVVENVAAPLAGGPPRDPPRPDAGAAGRRAGGGRRRASLDRHPEVDVIVVARGGGSLEDLLPFSDEAPGPGRLRLPDAGRVSAIGHETDTPILDLVADVRASTPTDAAKRVVPGRRRRGRASSRAGAGRAPGARSCAGSPPSSERLDDLRSRPVLRDPSGRDRPAAASGSPTCADACAAASAPRRSASRRTSSTTLARVRALSPQATLQRGYAILTTDDGAHHHVDHPASSPTRPSSPGCSTATSPRPSSTSNRTRTRGGRMSDEDRRATSLTYEAGARAAGRGGPPTRVGQRAAVDVHGAVGARREARRPLPAVARRREGDASTPARPGDRRLSRPGGLGDAARVAVRLQGSSPSSSGLGLRPFTAAAPVRIRLGIPLPGGETPGTTTA